MRKNFSRNQKRENRNAFDFYQTPYCLTETLLSHLFPKLKNEYLSNIFNLDMLNFSIGDFCCGKKAIGNVIRYYFNHLENAPIKYSLLEMDFPPLKEGNDFFSFEGKLDIGVMNPPFRLFNKWVEKCFEVFTVGFALLAPTTYLQGVSRFNAEGTGIFQNKEYPLSAIFTFNRYPMLSKELREDGKIETGMQALSWFVFQKGLPKGQLGTAHYWLDIDEYVLRKRGK